MKKAVSAQLTAIAYMGHIMNKLYHVGGHFSMTNEELAILAKQNDKTAIAKLWESTRRLTYKLAQPYFKLCERARITVEDMQQELFFAVLQAVKAFDPTSGNKFNSYLEYHVRNVCRAALGMRGKKHIDALLILDAPIGEDGDMTNGDLLEDTTIDLCAGAELTDLQRVVRMAVNRLPEPLRQAVELYYFYKMTLEEIGERIGVSREQARQNLQKAYRKLRGDADIRHLSQFFSDPRWNRLGCADWEQERALQMHPERERIERRITWEISMYYRWAYANSIQPSESHGNRIRADIIRLETTA